MAVADLSDQEFAQFQKMIYDIAGISLADSKKSLVSGRLSNRVLQHGLGSYGEYFKFLMDANSQAELQAAVDLLTTNETYFFREAKHLEFLQEHIRALHRPGRPFRVWSAASSSGEEAYSIAMLLADVLGEVPWEIVGSDISTRVLHKARQGHYPMARIDGIPRHYLHRFCLKGIGKQEGTFLVERALRERVKFHHINLNAALPALGEFDVIFLRNVLIYFDVPTKQRVIANLVPCMKNGGYFIVGHSESLNGISDALVLERPTIYRKR